MKLALIPPLDRLYDLHLTDYQMALPGPTEIQKSYVGKTGEDYIEAYRDASSLDNYVILDNGIAEGKAWDFDKLLGLADEIQASEVVLPDVISDAAGTLTVAEEAYRRAPGSYQYMYVAQGKSVQEAFGYTLRALSTMAVNTIGIPRHFVETIRFDARVQLVELLDNVRQVSQAPTFDIHLLGTNPTWMQEVKFIEKAFPGVVRGVDTSAPYVYSFSGGTINSTDCRHRYADYFTRPFQERSSVSYEVALLQNWCGLK